jgi:hypothetical protein
MTKKVTSKIKKSDVQIDDIPENEEALVAPKKRAVRKKATASTEKPVVKRARRSTKIDGAGSSVPAPVMKAFWGVFNPMMVQVAQYDYSEELDAQKAAADLTEKKKAMYFVQIIKKIV